MNESNEKREKITPRAVARRGIVRFKALSYITESEQNAIAILLGLFTLGLVKKYLL